MIPKNCLAIFGAVAAAHGVAAQLDVDSANAMGLLPKELKQRLQYCDSGSSAPPDSDRPCDIEKVEDGRLLQQAGLNPSLESDRQNATKLAAYRKGVEASPVRANAINCCLECKLRHKVHSEAQDKYWRSFYDDAKVKAWYALVDGYVPGKNSTAPPLLWNYLQSRSSGEVPRSDLDSQTLKVAEQKLDSYCPALLASKPKDQKPAPSNKKIEYPGRCMDFWLKAEASATAIGNSAKFPQNLTVSASAKVDVQLAVACPINVMDKAGVQVFWNATALVQDASKKLDAKAVASLSPVSACSCATGPTVRQVPATGDNLEKVYTSAEVPKIPHSSGNGGASDGSAGGSSKKVPASPPAPKPEVPADKDDEEGDAC